MTLDHPISRLPAWRNPGRMRGFTLVELMVGVLIALLTVLLVTEVFINADLRKRDIAGGSDAQQTSAMMMNYLSNSLRQAGSGLLRTNNVWGCAIKANKNGATLLPQTLQAPFDPLPAGLRVAPVAVRGGSTDPDLRESDILMVMSGSSQSANIAYKAIANPFSNSSIPIGYNSNGFISGDLLLATENAAGNDCNIMQVAAAPAFQITYTGGKLDDTPQTVPIGGVFAPGVALDTIVKTDDSILNLGQNPQFTLFGIDTASQTLEMYDLFQLNGINKPIAIGENVFLMRILYGIDDGTNGGTANDGLIDRWVSPATAGWTFQDLQAGTEDANKKIDQIKALRIALVTRTSYPTRDRYQPSLELFASVTPASLKQTVTLTADEQRYRYQVYETVMPLFNMQNLLRASTP